MMSLLEENQSSLKSKHEDLCVKLDVDVAAAKTSWESFSKIKLNFSLEGDQLHWIACALYVACRSSVTPTVQGGSSLEGNCVSLTKLLRLCNISLIQFFNKIKKWMEMSSMSVEFRHRIERLERKFAVSTVLYQKFKPIFEDIFIGLSNETTKGKSNKKHKLVPCTTNSLFEFTWCLFICVKGEFHGSADDLVDMYHLLLASLDFVFGNAFMAGRKDLINPEFSGLPPDWNSDNFQQPDEPPCIISILCKMREGLPLEASAAKQYSWRPVLSSFFSKGILKGDPEMLTGLIDLNNFDSNLKSLNNLYETYVLSVGEFDERIFLGEHTSSESVAPSNITKDELNKAIAKFGTSGRSHCPDTPLTGRRYLMARSEQLTPVSAATNSITRLHAYLQGCKPQPSAQLMSLFQESGISEDTIRTCVLEPCSEWQSRLTRALPAPLSSVTNGPQHVQARSDLAAALHYRTLEQILRKERARKPHVPLQSLISQEIFQRSLFACCTEIVLAAYGAHSLRFPWILDCLDLSAFHFYKIIELVVQVVMDKLSREVIKHLNAVEEQALESLVWASSSPIWDRLENATIPASIDVYTHETPKKNNMQSPVSSASERFVSPMADQARKQLFKDTDIKPGQSLLVTKVESEPNLSSNSSSNGSHSEEIVESPEIIERRNKGGSLVLFFRKVYSLAVARMKDLCTKLKLNDTELRKKIWTFLEHSIRAQTKLLKDRHLDQLLMCAVYVICKVSNSRESPVERTFTEIMRCYRQQPQADNHVYRSVLIPSDNENEPPERGDLIKFYNKVYVKCMQSYAMRFAHSARQRDECSLSPLPAGRARGSPGGGRCVSERHRLYVSSLPSSPLPAPHAQLTYRFSRSPAKDLRAINDMLAAEPRRKRAAPPAGQEPRSRKLQCLINDRQAV